MTTDYNGIITIIPGLRSGKPTVGGMRITVADVLSYLKSGMSHNGVIEEFPQLTKEDIMACLSYAADHTVEYEVPFQE